jgi:hypothetical protein
MREEINYNNLSKYLNFTRNVNREEGRKTEVWAVESMADILLGEIRWYPNWRQYAFFPSTATVFNHDCLDVIGIVLRSLNEKHRSKALG